MISFDTGNHRFNLRAAAIIVQGEYVLLHRLDGDDFWSLPGGRVEPGEHAAQTVVREMQEEVGASIRIGKMLCVVENFFIHNGRRNHEIGLYFAATLEPDSPLLDLAVAHRGSEKDKGLTFAWFLRRELSDMDVRPAFLRQFFKSNLTQMVHVVQQD